MRITDASPAATARSSSPAIASSCASGVMSRAQPRVRHVRELDGDAVRHLAHDRQDRALGGLADRGVGAVGGARERGADQGRVDQLAGAAEELLGGAVDQLREDHAAVAARPEQRCARDRLDDLVAPDLVDRAVPSGGQPVELGEHGLHRQDHVVAGVAVGDGKHVEVVDLLATGLQVRERPGDQGAKTDQIGVSHDPGRTYRALVTLPALRQRVQT